MRKDARIYVAGHRGLIGSAVLRRLKAEGCNGILTRTRRELELSDARRVDAFFRRYRPELVVLAAGRTGGIAENASKPAALIAENLAVQLNVMGAARRHGARRLLFFGSSCMYPRACPQPMREESLWAGPLEPTSRAYAAAKLAGVETCLAFNAEDRVPRFLPLIPNSVYGPGDDFDPASAHVLGALISRLHDAARRRASALSLWGSGKPRREFLYSDDLADACWMLLNADVSRLALPVNVGGGADVSIRELAALIARVVGYGGRIEWDESRPDGAPVKRLDGRRLRSLGWRPRTPIEEGIRRAYAWHQMK